MNNRGPIKSPRARRETAARTPAQTRAGARPTPKVLQPKPAAPPARPTPPPPPARPTPAPPPVYKPQPSPKVLQRKPAAARPAGVAVSATRPTPVAPPPYRPQPAPKASQAGSKVLQPKPAAGRPARGAQAQAPAPPRAVVQPKTSARNVAPPARPTNFPAPPALARAPRPQFAPQPRPNIIQRMEQVGTGGGDPPEDDWQKIWALEQKKFIPNKDKKKSNNNNWQKDEEDEPPPSNVAPSNEHLGEFGNTLFVGKVTGKNNKSKWTDANVVNFLAKVNNVIVPASNANIPYANQITSPSNDKEVTNTTNDGEVSKLVATMRSFVTYLNNPLNQAARQDFTVTIYGAWGACDGCKERILAFARIWEDVARAKMNTNVTATLTITYKYLAEPTIIHQTWGDTVYGWWEDGKGEGPFFHTIKTSVMGK